MRIGHGFDAHRFCKGNQITLGGVKIPHSQAMLAHSDGDVLIHAVCDAILGALGLGDIGHHFPDNNAAFKDIDSAILLERVMQEAQKQRLCVANLDSTIIAQAPKLAPYITNMRKRLAELLRVAEGQVNIKATTTEEMGYTGRGEGIAAHAVVLLVANG
jgi:2-C-methyl-D-erythritol 2,4-cyclodiphosphate synthase